MTVPRKKKISIFDLTYIAVGAALICVCSWITIPLPTVPITLQTFAVFCVLGAVGGARGTAAVAVYIALGATGLPVFSGFRGGVGVLAGMTGGYILGFLFSAGFYWLLTSRIKDRLPARIIGMAGGLLICYVFGTAWFVIGYMKAVSIETVAYALSQCVFPFLLPDAVKLTLAFVVSSAIAKRIGRGS